MSNMNLVFVKKARKNIYVNGCVVKANNKRGWRIDRETPNPDGDTLLVSRGESYWHWKFRNDPYTKYYSKEKPEFWQLLSSPVLREIAKTYYLPVDTSKLTDNEDYRSYYVGSIERAKNETQKSLGNIKPHLRQKVKSWHILNERLIIINEFLETVTRSLTPENIGHLTHEEITSVYRDIAKPYVSKLLKTEL